MAHPIHKDTTFTQKNTSKNLLILICTSPSDEKIATIEEKTHCGCYIFEKVLS